VADSQVCALITALRRSFDEHADPARAAAMQAYMKSALQFYGIAAPLRRRLTALAVQQHPMPDTTNLAATMRRLFRDATHREERYAAMELARAGGHARLLTLQLLPLYEEMITASAWWDICDDISGNALPALLLAYPAPMKAQLRQWAQSGDLWLRRAAMLSQRTLKRDFDAVLLYETVLPSLSDPRFAREFFICKGMGWALRERSYAAPEEVQAFCREYAHCLSPLTQREALKAIRRRQRLSV
jgi:3-methyladenine DNA glycosylase AlkD